MKHLALAVLAAFAVAGCTMTSPEKFIQPWPLPPEQWRGSEGRVQGHDARKFENASSGDAVFSLIMDSMDGFPASEYRRTFDQTQADGCTTWTSQLLDETPLHDYPRQIWLTECGLGGDRWRAILHLYITGKDAGYYTYLEWKNRPDTPEVQKWADFMRDVEVCDERPERKVPCPTMTPVSVPQPPPAASSLSTSQISAGR